MGKALVGPSLRRGSAEPAGDWGTPELHLLPLLPGQWASLQPSLLSPAAPASQQGLGGLQLGLLPKRGSEPNRDCAAENSATIADNFV